MKYYILEPEVAGGLGVNTVMNRSTHPPIITRLHYELDGWLGDELLETFPCYIVTHQLRNKIEKAGFTGLYFDTVEVSISQQFKDLYPNRNIPDFVWLKIIGRAGIDDFGVSKDNRLVVSESVLGLMNLKHCSVSEFTM
jgi:hypothetical protein